MKDTLKTLLLKQISRTVFVFVYLALLFYVGNIAGNSLFPPKNSVKIEVIEGEINPGQSLYEVLSSDFSANQTLSLERALSDVFNASRTRPGDKYCVYHSTSGSILKFIYEPSPLLNYVVKRTSGGFVASKGEPEYDKKTVGVKGRISSSLWQGMADAGLNSNMIMNFANIFQWQVDFLTEVRPDDEFFMVFERYYRNGEPVENGSILAAHYAGRRNFSAVRFEDGDRIDFYDFSGSSLRKQFLRAPLNYKRISSGFSYARKHPITREVRPHFAIDYAAPTGTPISSIGSGRVTYVGWRGGWGKTVRVRHNSVYTTQYAHLSRYASGIRVNSRVSQGQVVGYVGMTGVATGPHLDFRIEKNGNPVNFLALHFPPARSVSDENMESFKQYVNWAGRYMEYLESDFFAGQIRPIDDFRESIEYATVFK